MDKICPKCNDRMIQSGKIKVGSPHLAGLGDRMHFIDAVTDVLDLFTCKKCGYCETWVPDFLIDDLQNEASLQEQDPNRTYYEASD